MTCSSLDEAWDQVELVQQLFSDEAAKQLAFALRLVSEMPGPNDPVPVRTIH